MSAYVIVNIAVTEPKGYEEYKRLAAPTVKLYGGRYLVRGGQVEVLEGDWCPARYVILEFPTVQRAREWWDSPEYRPLRAIRQRTAESSLIVAEGC
jgi:uncharacterized protein (DUF1330 family)